MQKHGKYPLYFCHLPRIEMRINEESITFTHHYDFAVNIIDVGVGAMRLKSITFKVNHPTSSYKDPELYSPL